MLRAEFLDIGKRGALWFGRWRIEPHQFDSFFMHLIDVLGPDDFLAPICMLLVQKTAARAIRRQPEEALSLPLTMLHNYSTSIKTSVRDVFFRCGRNNNMRTDHTGGDRGDTTAARET